MTNASKKGFTLVELSIVLVIIGLLIGGILVAQSMIGTAKIQALTRQIGQYDAAVANFQTKFNALPGDNTLFGSTGVTVNGTILSAVPDTIAFTGEIGRFWYDLGQSGLTNESGAAYVSSATTAAVTPGTNVPAGKAGTNTTFVAYGVSGSNYYAIGKGSGSATIVNAVSFKPADALALDTKIDDGLSFTGNVRGSDSGVLLPSQHATGAAYCLGGSANSYNVGQTTDNCTLDVRLGTSTGVLN